MNGPGSGRVLLTVWAAVQQAAGAITPAAIAQTTGLDPDLTQAALDWLVRRGRVQRWDDGRVCPATAGMACRLCALRAWCSIPTEDPAQP